MNKTRTPGFARPSKLFHEGQLGSSGHFTTVIWDGTMWLLCNDEHCTYRSKPQSDNNYMYFYDMIDSPSPSAPHTNSDTEPLPSLIPPQSTITTLGSPPLSDCTTSLPSTLPSSIGDMMTL